MASHGWGEMNGGTFRSQLALDIDRALSYMRKNHAEQIVLAEVRELSWNAAIVHKLSSKDPWPDALPAEINLTQLAAETGCSRAHLSFARTRLLKDRVLIEIGRGVTINKDVDQWDASRITPQAKERARIAREMKSPTRKKPLAVPDPVQQSVSDRVQQPYPNGYADQGCIDHRIRMDTPLDTPPDTAPDTPPADAGRFKTHAGARAGEDVFLSSPELNSKNSLSPTPTPEPTLVGGGGGGVERESENPARDRKTRLTAWVRENFGKDLLPARKLNAIVCGDEPEEWVREAIRRAAGEANKDEAVARFAAGHLARFKANGRMDEPPKAEAPATVKLTPNELWEQRRAISMAAGRKAFPKPGTVSDVQQG